MKVLLNLFKINKVSFLKIFTSIKLSICGQGCVLIFFGNTVILNNHWLFPCHRHGWVGEREFPVFKTSDLLK